MVTVRQTLLMRAGIVVRGGRLKSLKESSKKNKFTLSAFSFFFLPGEKREEIERERINTDVRLYDLYIFPSFKFWKKIGKKKN